MNRVKLLLRFFISLWCTCLSVLPLSGQEYSYVNYNTREGLAGSIVYCMVQDHDGFMWFGTEAGLSRFDGSRFTNFTTTDGLPDNDIIKLFVDSRNRVWITPFKNAICYYWRGKIYNAGNDSVLKRIQLLHEVTAIAENSIGEILLLNHRQVVVIGTNGNIVDIREFEGDPIAAGFCTGLKDEKTFLVSISTIKGLAVAKVAYDKLVSQSSWSSKKYPAYISHISPRLEIYTGTDSIYIRLPQQNTRKSFPVPPGFISHSIINDSLVAFSSDSVKLYNLYRGTIGQVFLPGKSVSSTMRDRELNWWFTTMGEGVYRIASGDFKNYTFDSGAASLPVVSLIKKGNVLIAGGTHFRLWSFNLENGSVYSQKVTARRTIGRIVTLDALPGGALLAGADFGIFKIEGENIKEPTLNTATKDVYISSDTILNATSIGIFSMNAAKMEITDTLWKGRVTALYKQTDQLYFGTLNGLFIKNDDREAAYAGHLHPALSGRISGIRADKRGLIWIITNGNGVVAMQSGRAIAWLRKSEGLTSDICRALFIAGDTVWIGTDKGLNRIIQKKDQYEIKRYTTADGLISNSINTILAEGNDVFVGTPEGITHFDQDKVSTNSMCVLKMLSIRSPRHLWQFDTTGLEFGHWENDIRFEFSGISFKSAGEITYRYRLKGLQPDWKETKDNFLNYISLPSGSYELELIAINKFGVESELVRVQFNIAQLFWEKIWVRLAAVLLLATIVWRYIQYRIRRVRKQEAAKLATSRKIIELEQSALKAQMNPHFIFNCLHSIQQYVIDKDIKGANKFITDFARLIRLTLEISAQPKISLADEVNYISTYLELEKSKFEDKFHYEIEVAGDIDQQACFIPAMILQPYVENSIRHGINYRADNSGKISIRFSTENSHLACQIEDNGVGRKASEQLKGEGHGYKSWGMSLTMKRIELLNGDYGFPIMSDIEDVRDNNEIRGTRVTIRFPIEEVKKRD